SLLGLCRHELLELGDIAGPLPHRQLREEVGVETLHSKLVSEVLCENTDVLPSVAQWRYADPDCEVLVEILTQGVSTRTLIEGASRHRDDPCRTNGSRVARRSTRWAVQMVQERTPSSLIQRGNVRENQAPMLCYTERQRAIVGRAINDGEGPAASLRRSM